MLFPNSMQQTICIVGLGYVGLPLAIAFARKTVVIGFDVNAEKIVALKNKKDSTNAVTEQELIATTVFFTNNPEEIKNADYIIVAVPTPVDNAKHPDISYLESASKLVGKNLKKGAIVIYESTVYPGLTEKVCLPILEKESGMKLGEFGLGYSPERINPGDKEHQLHNTVKIVSGHNEETREKIAVLYEQIIAAGVYKASSIQVAEAAKIVENVQRDMNIALTNELALIFDKLNIDTKEVLDAAATKWNFHKYYPGLVGGHCIGVDPYYLAFQAAAHGYHPKIILSGREVNDYMAKHVAELCLKELTKAGKILSQCTVVLFGLTFKENVTDLRNSRALDVMRNLQEYGVTIVACEPNVSEERIQQECTINTCSVSTIPDCDAVIIINKHAQFSTLSLETCKEKMKTPILIDTKRLFSKKEAEELGFVYKAL